MDYAASNTDLAIKLKRLPDLDIFYGFPLLDFISTQCQIKNQFDVNLSMTVSILYHLSTPTHQLYNDISEQSSAITN